MENTICHFEIPANNVEKLAEFYKKAFNWKIEKTPGPMEYWMIRTSKDNKALGGGMMKKKGSTCKVPHQYVLVESIVKHSKKIEKLGGKIVVPKTEIPGYGWYAMVLDPEGNMFGIFEGIKKK